MPRQRLCFESKKRKNDSNVRPEKRQNLQSRKGWRKNLGENKKKRKHVRKKKNARGIWLIVWRRIASLPLNNNGEKIGPRIFFLHQIHLPTRR